LRERVTLLESELLRAVHLDRTAIHVALRPDPPLSPAGLVVEAEDRRVEVRQCVQIDEAGRDQRLATGVADIDLTGKTVTDEDDAIVLVDDLAVLDQAVAAGIVADHPVGGKPRAHQATSECAELLDATTRLSPIGHPGAIR
jgi:hypothetical protein